MRLPSNKNTRSALTIIDMQEFFFKDAARRHNLEAVITNINNLIEHFDQHLLPVFHVVSCYKADGSDWDLKMKFAGKPELIEGTQEAAILDNLKFSKKHKTVIKKRYSAFFKTNLAQLLLERKIDRVVVVGAYTHYCVNATIFDAYCYDFIPCIITDAVLSHLKEEANIMIDRMRRNGYHVFSSQEFIAERECI